MIERAPKIPLNSQEESIDSSFFTESEVIPYKDNLPEAVRKVGDLVARYGLENVLVRVEPPESVRVYYSVD